MLGNEINELKDIILKLQSFTMNVNKALFDKVNSDVFNKSDTLDKDKTQKSTFESMMEQSQNGTDNAL